MDKLTKKQALELHRQMWTDMMNSLGENPDPIDRIDFKSDWCKKWCETHDYERECIDCDCFLCECSIDCPDCIVDWGKAEDITVPMGGYGKCTNPYKGYGRYYLSAPIPLILAVPEREQSE